MWSLIDAIRVVRRVLVEWQFAAPAKMGRWSGDVAESATWIFLAKTSSR